MLDILRYRELLQVSCLKEKLTKIPFSYMKSTIDCSIDYGIELPNIALYNMQRCYVKSYVLKKNLAPYIHLYMTTVK